jgi:hypothetical protein
LTNKKISVIINTVRGEGFPAYAIAKVQAFAGPWKTFIKIRIPETKKGPEKTLSSYFKYSTLTKTNNKKELHL